MDKLLTTLAIGLLALGGYFIANYHAVYSKNCVMTVDGLKCQLDHYERNK